LYSAQAEFVGIAANLFDGVLNKNKQSFMAFHKQF
jgi:hypothetical protein